MKFKHRFFFFGLALNSRFPKSRNITAFSMYHAMSPLLSILKRIIQLDAVKWVRKISTISELLYLLGELLAYSKMLITNTAGNEYILLLSIILQKEICKKVRLLSSHGASYSETPKESWIAAVLPSVFILLQKRWNKDGVCFIISLKLFVTIPVCFQPLSSRSNSNAT